MEPELARLWKDFCSDNYMDKCPPRFRQGSSFRKARPWVEGRESPSHPVKMLSVRDVYSGWSNPAGVKLAKKFLETDPNLTMRELAELMLRSKSDYPYIWWCYGANAPVKRAIYEDAEGLNFVKLNNKWQMAYSTLSSGILVGCQSGKNYEDLPPNAYFVLWENEGVAREHTG